MSNCRTIALCLLTTAVLLGCGQSGPLYLPGDPSAVETPTVVTPATGGEEDDDTENDGQ